MSLLDSASLIVTPNAYKEGKLYSVIPSDGSGDMSVTRATTATRVNSAGLVELVPYNLLTWSQDLSASWALNQATTTTSQADPFGGTKAIKLKYNTSVNYHAITQSVSLTGPNAHSVYAKAGELQFLQIASAQSIEEYANFNLSTGVVGTYGLLTSNVQIENVGNGWYRCSVVFTNGSNGIYFAIANSASMGWLGIDTFAGANATDGLYLYGAQVNAGSLLPYQKTETRLNIPRLDYSNGTCPSLLVEPQRTNISNYSESSNPFNAAIVTNAADLLGMKAYKVQADYSLGDAPNVPCADFTANTTYTASAYIDFNSLTGTEYVTRILGFFPSVEFAAMTVNKATKAIISSTSGGGVWTINTAKIEHQKDEVYRVILTATTNTAGVGARTYVDSGNNKSINVAGIQVEVSSYPTSYIQKTTSASVTRNADSVSKTGISSLIGQTEGTLYFEGIAEYNTEICSINQSAQNSIFIYSQAGYGVFGYIYADGSGISFGSLVNPLTKFKAAIAYKTNSMAMYINGNLIQEYTGFSFTPNVALTTLFIAQGGYVQGKEKVQADAIALWKTRLTNDQLAQLTTI